MNNIRTKLVRGMLEYVFVELKLPPDSIWLAGGAARNYLYPLFPGYTTHFDFDFFCKNQEVYDLAVAALMKDNCHRYDDDFTTTFKTRQGWLSLYKRSFYDSPMKVIEDFDFTIAQFALEWNDGEIVSHSGALSLEDHSARRLRINKIQRPVSALKRVHKFIQLGYRPVDGFYEQLVEAIRSCPHENL